MIEEKIFRNSKNSIFLDLFSIPEYLLQLVKTLHSEMTDLKKAIENTIKICQNLDVLKEYLESRKKEVMDIMFILFDQDYNTELYAKEQAILTVAETFKDLGLSIEDYIKKIVAKFNINQERAANYVNDVWENKISSEKYSDEHFEKAKSELIELKKYIDEYNK